MNQEQKRAHWASVIEQQQHSQLSIKQFCTDNNISYQTFYYWSKRLRTHDKTQTLHPIVFDEHSHPQSTSVTIAIANGIHAELPTTLIAAQIKTGWMPCNDTLW
jgi:hypothetical protein